VRGRVVLLSRVWLNYLKFLLLIPLDGSGYASHYPFGPATCIFSTRYSPRDGTARATRLAMEQTLQTGATIAEPKP
jgi:hypothetical protein